MLEYNSSYTGDGSLEVKVNVLKTGLKGLGEIPTLIKDIKDRKTKLEGVLSIAQLSGVEFITLNSMDAYYLNLGIDILLNNRTSYSFKMIGDDDGTEIKLDTVDYIPHQSKDEMIEEAKNQMRLSGIFESKYFYPNKTYRDENKGVIYQSYSPVFDVRFEEM